MRIDFAHSQVMRTGTVALQELAAGCVRNLSGHYQSQIVDQVQPRFPLCKVTQIYLGVDVSDFTPSLDPPHYTFTWPALDPRLTLMCTSRNSRFTLT